MFWLTSNEMSTAWRIKVVWLTNNNRLSSISGGNAQITLFNPPVVETSTSSQQKHNSCSINSVMLYYIILHYIILYYELYYIILYYICYFMLYILWYIILYYIILHYIILCTIVDDSISYEKWMLIYQHSSTYRLQ